MILCSPNFVINPKDQIYKWLLSVPGISHFFLTVYPVCHRPYESRIKKNRNSLYPKKCHIFYEKNFPLTSAIEMWKFQDILPINTYANNIVMIKANNDKLIGDMNKQKKVIEDISETNVNIIHIPSNNKSNIKVGHNIFNSSDEIIYDFYCQIEELIK